jgi:HEAT repeats/PBS lyase HEAT-like repeat
MARTSPSTTELNVPQLIDRLESPDWAERFHAAFTLGQMGTKARKAVLALIEALEDGDMHVRKAAVLALGEIGPDAREAVLALGEVLLNDGEPAVRRRAAVALGEIGALEAVAELEAACSEDDNRGDASAEELAAFVQKNYGVTVRPQFVPVLKATLKDKENLAGWRRKSAAAQASKAAPWASPRLHEPSVRLAAFTQKGPAGRSSLAAYQTCRASASFGRAMQSRPDTGRRPGLCTLARSAGQRLRILARQGTRRAEADVIVTVRRQVPVTVGGTHVHRLVVERAATQHTANTTALRLTRGTS